MRVLITGITGMVGSHLADYILAEHPDVEVHGILRWRSPRDNIAHLAGRCQLHLADLRDLRSLIEVLAAVQPDWIFHLAAQSFVPFSFTAPAETLETNVVGTSNLLEAMLQVGSKAKIHVCSSSEVYGQVQADEVPITESNPLRPASPYAVSKVGQDMLAQQYHRTYGMQTVVTRMFTHTGPRRGDVFAESAFAKQIAEVEAGVRANPIKVGNLDSIRTIADVRDAVRAYWLLMEKCPAGEVYNIGGDVTMTVGDVLSTLEGLARCEIAHEVAPELLRSSDVTRQIPDSTPFRKATGWVPTILPEQTLADLLDYQRARLAVAGTQR